MRQRLGVRAQCNPFPREPGCRITPAESGLPPRKKLKGRSPGCGLPRKGVVDEVASWPKPWAKANHRVDPRPGVAHNQGVLSCLTPLPSAGGDESRGASRPVAAGAAETAPAVRG